MSPQSPLVSSPKDSRDGSFTHASLPFSVEIPIQVLPHGGEWSLPSYATPGSAGMDLYAALSEPLTLEPGTWALVPSGIAIALPPHYEAQVRSRSGLAYKHGLSILNAPGTIDSDYRGEIKGLLINHSRVPFVVTPGLRFAQLIIAPVTQGQWKVVSDLEETVRGEGGFGSTGTSHKGKNL